MTMCNLLSNVKDYIQDHSLISPQTVVLIAVSGGADSVSLLHMLYRLRTEWPFTIHVAHLNHNLRANAQKDADFVTQTANALDIPISVGSAQVSELAKKEKRSIEDAARRARRDFLLKLAQKIGASRIALGHTKNDQAETILFRILRGTSLTGLSGIRPIAQELWIRPLLDVSRSQIEAYVAHHNLQFCVDESNTDLKFARNKIRHQLLPLIKNHYAPQIESALTRLGHLAKDDDALLENLCQDAFQKVALYCSNRKIILDVKQIFGYHISLRRRLLKKALFELGISENTVTFQSINRLLDSLDLGQAHIQISADLSAHRINGLLLLVRPAPPFNVPICLQGNTSFPIQNARILATRHAKPNTAPINSNDAYTVFFDADQLPPSLFIREVQPGDRFQPFGFSGRQKINKLLSEHKIPKPLREEIPVLVGDNQILWVLGLRRSNYAPITSKTKHIQQLIFEGGWQRIVTHPELR
jgi:tRNA(Ile)-lysidine synthase